LPDGGRGVRFADWKGLEGTILRPFGRVAPVLNGC
jgi:hypothetical protein